MASEYTSYNAELRLGYTVFEGLEALPKAWQDLVLASRKAIGTAYAPYSNFRVGAALALKNEAVVLGSNQENSAYPSGLCAERVALFSAGTRYPGIEIEALAVAAQKADSNSYEPGCPCGSCRQVMLESEARQKGKIKLIMEAEGGKFIVLDSVSQLLPFAFGPKNLGF